MIDSTPIRGKVARILTSRELALNIGQEAGVTVGMEFDVLYPKGEDITDPDTGEVLGSLRRPKVRVRVVQVKPRISLAETFRSHRINIGGTGINMPKTFSLTRLLMPPEWIERYETFKTTERAWEDIEESQSYVKAGDPVIQVIQDEPVVVNATPSDVSPPG